MSRWFRHYAGMMRDEKLVAVALRAKQPIERVVWVWGAILESAAEINDGGRFDFDTEEAAYFLRIDVTECNAVVTALAEKGRVTGDRIANWDKRQFKSDDSSERVRKHREKKTEEKQRAFTQGCNNPETLRNAPETETETETEKKKESTSLRSVRSDVRRETFSDDWPSDYREQFWAKYPRKVGRKSAFRKLEAIRRSGEVTWERLCGGVLKIPKDEPKFIPHPLTWLTRGGWDDEEISQVGGENVQRKRSVQDAAADLVNRMREFDRPAPSDIRGGEGGSVVRLLSQG